ncbi:MULTISPECIES: hypothetical protein [Pseudomonas]|jgi:hypothetical protein|nr:MULTISPECIES: hypothetical protein [Pseudomonas]KVV09481.1 hypothetical protein AP060_00689 [Pseudomonas sp. TAD18]KVV10163.1 hypothetical protein AP059_00619 [Pseudomonas sp. TAA207]
MSSTWLWLSGVSVGFALLAWAWWGWHQGALALMQLGMGVC